MLVSVPPRSQVVEPDPVKSPQRRLAQFATQYEIPFVDLLDDFTKDADPGGLFHDDMHLSESGHARAADVLAEQLLRYGFVSAPSGKHADCSP